MHRFRFIGKRIAKNNWQIEGEELHHLTKVLRLSEGALVEVCNGSGYSAKGTLRKITKIVAEIIADEENFENEPTNLITIAIGAIKHSDADEILPMLVELGAHQISFFGQEGTPKHRLNPKSHERWKRIIRSALKQSKRSFLPKLTLAEDISKIIKYHSKTATKLFMDEFAQTDTNLERWPPNTDAIIIVGGEKGLDSEERSLLQTMNFTGIRLGSHILRAKTAAVAAATIASAKRAP